MRMGELSGRAMVCLLLAASGVLMVIGARERWWPACRLGDYDADPCLIVQDHQYDYLFVSEPWTPLGNAAELSGVGMLLLAVAVGVLPWLWLPKRRVLALAFSMVLSLMLVPVAAAQILSGRAGQVVEVPGLTVASFGWAVAWPVALVALVVLSSPGPAISRFHVGARMGLFGSLLFSTPLPLVLLSPVFTGYVSYDTSPWTEAVLGVVLFAAAVTAWPATARPSNSPLPGSDHDDHSPDPDSAVRVP